MPNALPPGFALPKPTIPKWVGLFNILFGVALILVGLAYAAWTIVSSDLAEEANKTLVAALQEKAEAQKVRDSIDQLKEMEASAETKEDRERYKAERIELEANPPKASKLVAAPPNLWRKSPRAATFFWAEVVAGLALNLVMVVAGIGLVMLQEWARRLALWVAGLKVARLLAMAVISILWIIPAESKRDAAELAEFMAVYSPGQMSPSEAKRFSEQQARVQAIVASTSSVGLLIAGSVYPVLAMFLVTRPGARAACLASRRSTRRITPVSPPSQ